MWHSGPTLVKRFILVVVIDAYIHNTRPLLVDQSFGQGLTGGMPGEEHNPLSLSKRCAAQLPVPMPLPEIVEVTRVPVSDEVLLSDNNAFAELSEAEQLMEAPYLIRSVDHIASRSPVVSPVDVDDF